MLLCELVSTWEQVRATRSRSGKIAVLAACLARMTPAEVPAGASFLSGEHPLGRLGVGGRTLAAATPPPT